MKKKKEIAAKTNIQGFSSMTLLINFVFSSEKMKKVIRYLNLFGNGSNKNLSNAFILEETGHTCNHSHLLNIQM